MGKKNKHKYDDFEASVNSIDSTFKSLTDIDDIIYGRKSASTVFDIAKGKITEAPKIADNGLPDELNNIIYKKMTSSSANSIQSDADADEEDDDTNVTPVDDFISSIMNNTSNTSNDDDEEDEEDIAEEDEDIEENSYFTLANNRGDDEEGELQTDYDSYFDSADEADTYRSINFIHIGSLKRLVINDGIVPTSFSYEFGLNDDYNAHKIVYDNMDADMCCDDFNLLLRYIITLKHPTAIYTIEEFKQSTAFRHVTDYDRKQFLFFNIDNKYVLCYHLEPNNYECFIDGFVDYDLSDTQITQVMVSLAYVTGSIHNSFYSEDMDYVDSIYENEEYNYQDEFKTLLVTDASTVVADVDDDNEEYEGVIFTDILDFRDIQLDARDRLMELTESGEDNESGEELDKDGETDADELFGDEMESVDDQSMIAVVHRKTDNN